MVSPRGYRYRGDGFDLPEPPDVKTWTTRDGRAILLTDLEDSHLLNVIRMVARNIVLHGLLMLSYPRPEGEMAQLAFDQEISEYGEEIEDLQVEADRRGLDWKTYIGVTHGGD